MKVFLVGVTASIEAVRFQGALPPLYVPAFESLDAAKAWRDMYAEDAAIVKMEDDPDPGTTCDECGRAVAGDQVPYNDGDWWGHKACYPWGAEERRGATA